MHSRLISTTMIVALGLFAYPVLAQQTTPEPETRTGQSTEEMGEAVGDAWITTKVKSDLLATEDVAGSRIDVDTKDGVVTLTGNVESQAEADKAVSVAKAIKGVTQVTSNLQVAPMADE